MQGSVVTRTLLHHCQLLQQLDGKKETSKKKKNNRSHNNSFDRNANQHYSAVQCNILQSSFAFVFACLDCEQHLNTAAKLRL